MTFHFLRSLASTNISAVLLPSQAAIPSCTSYDHELHSVLWEMWVLEMLVENGNGYVNCYPFTIPKPYLRTHDVVANV